MIVICFRRIPYFILKSNLNFISNLDILVTPAAEFYHLVIVHPAGLAGTEYSQLSTASILYSLIGDPTVGIVFYSFNL